MSSLCPLAQVDSLRFPTSPPPKPDVSVTGQPLRIAGRASAHGLAVWGISRLEMSARWTDLGIDGVRVVRDLWRQRDLGPLDASFSATVPRHGVVLVTLRPAASNPQFR